MEKALRLGFIIPTLKSGGAERVVSVLANHLVSKYPILIITLIQGEIHYDLDPRVQVLSLRENRPSANPIDAIINNVQSIRRLRGLIRTHRIELLIGFTTTANVLSILAATLQKIPVIISERNNAMVEPPRTFWRFLRNRLFRKADFLVVQTRGNKDFYKSIAPERMIKVIPNPVFGIQREKVIVSDDNAAVHLVTVGRLDYNKGIDTGLRALSLLKSDDWSLTIAGTGPLLENLKALSEELGIRSRVHFAGHLRDIAEMYKKADIFLFSSRSEGFPNALLEAYCFGLPCVSTDCPFGPAEIITNGSDGFLVPVDDAHEMAEKVQLLIEDSELRSQFSRNALARARRFETEHIVQNWEALIDEIRRVRS